MRRWLIILVAAPIIFWSAYWAGVAFLLTASATDLLENQLPEPLSVQVSDTQIRGYPADFRLYLTDMTLEDRDVFAWTSPSVVLNAPSYRPHNIQMVVSGPQQIRSQLGDLVITAENFEVTVLVNPVLDVSLGRAQINLEDALLVHDAGWQILLGNLRVLLQDTAQPGYYDMAAALSSLGLSDLLPDLPSPYTEIRSMQASAVLEFSSNWDRGLLENGPPSLRRVLIEETSIMFGQSLISVTGQLEVAADNRLSGALSLDITSWRELLLALRGAGYIDPDIADLIIQFLGNQSTSDEITIPLDIRDGQVQFGIFTLGVLPTLP